MSSVRVLELKYSDDSADGSTEGDWIDYPGATHWQLNPSELGHSLDVFGLGQDVLATWMQGTFCRVELVKDSNDSTD